MENQFKNTNKIVIEICRKHPNNYVEIYNHIQVYIRYIKKENTELTFEEANNYIAELRVF